MADAKPEEPPEDPLKNATTLYVGNLSVPCSRIYLTASVFDICTHLTICLFASGLPTSETQRCPGIKAGKVKVANRFM